jgi:nitrate/TMAO reductase-like tetraheme cytochrome c subunit
MDKAPKKSSRFGIQFRNWISLTGAVVSGGSIFAFFLLFAIDIVSHHGNPYMGILAYVVSPMFFFIGMGLLVVGAWLQRRRTKGGSESKTFTIDLSRKRDKKAMIGFIAGAVIFLLVTAMGSYNTYHYTESVNFCGQACHTPMKPEYTAYLNSSHARVACTECHVGPGAESYVRSKINGVHQLYCVATDSYRRPIPAPLKHLRPAQETCEQCHWPQKFVGNLDRTYSHFLSDETNTPFTVRLSLKVGGADPSHGPTGGIHWHMNVANKIEYMATDSQRQIIPWVRVTSKDGKVTEYRVKGFKDSPVAEKIRVMDCLDCHNRPAHNYKSPNDAVDLSMTLGGIDTSLPWVKSNAVAVLVLPYKTEDEAMTKIDASLRTSYNKSPHVDRLVEEVQNIYKQNFFPEMKSDWRSYPDNIGHKNWNGCFRCHDGLHKAADGKASIEASNCNSCHTIVAQGNGPQLEQLSAKGLDFFHIDSQYSDFSCNNCHTGAATK